MKADGFDERSVFLHYLCRDPIFIHTHYPYPTQTSHYIHWGIFVA